MHERHYSLSNVLNIIEEFDHPELYGFSYVLHVQIDTARHAGCQIFDKMVPQVIFVHLACPVIVSRSITCTVVLKSWVCMCMISCGLCLN